MRTFHTYAGILRFSSFVDLRRIVYSNTLSLIIAIAVHYLIFQLPSTHFEHLNARMLTVIYLMATLVMCFARIVMKSLYEVKIEDSQAKRCLIYGTMSDSVALAKSFSVQNPIKLMLRGFITDEIHDSHAQMMGVRIFNPRDDLNTIIKTEQIHAVVVSPLSKQIFRRDQRLQDVLLNAQVKIYMARGAVELDQLNMKDGKDALNQLQLHEVQVEDLLPRDEIKVDMESVGRQLGGKRILVTGSAGSIGSEIVRQVARYKPAAMMLIDHAETPEHDVRLMMEKDYPKIEAETVVTSICKQDRMEEIFSRFKPDYVFHAAAYKHVPMMEDNPSEAIQNNVLGTKVIADLSVKYGVKKFVMVSTDKAVNPTNVMGCSKRICEIYVQSLNNAQKVTQFVTTRFGNVLGSNGSVIPLFREQIKNGGPVTVTHPDIIRYFMLISEACKLVLEAGTKGHGGEIFVFDMGEPVKIADLARRMISLSGASDVRIEFTGLRPGEKLYEEVINEEENTLPSFHDKIRIAKVREYNYTDICKKVDELIAISKRYDDMETVKKMKEIVPEYLSNNSVFEKLDK
jgi:FlaA1/EpsC-like NDP-sugar epimerase